MGYDRITRRDIERRFLQVFDGHVAVNVGEGGTNAHNIGKYFLDHNSVYGGYVVGVYSGGDSGAGYAHGSTRWGTRRRAGRAMYDWLDAFAYGADWVETGCES